MRKPSIREVAKIAGVSTATVSNVFSNKKYVNEALKEKVRAAADMLGYQVDRAASQLRSRCNKIVTVLVPNITDTFFATIVSHIEDLAFSQGYDVIVANAHDRVGIEASRIQALLSWRPAGMIAVPSGGHLSDEMLQLETVCPTVLVDRVAIHASPFDTVTIDNEVAGGQVADHLLAKGHRHILVIASNLTFPPIKDRVEGALQRFKRMSDTHVSVIELGSELETGAELIGQWLDQHPHPSAIYAVNNVTTLSTLTALAEREIQVGKAISLLAFDDYNWMSARSVGLTAIRQPTEHIAQCAWERLITRIERGIKNEQPEATILDTELIVRQSVEDLNDAASRESVFCATESISGFTRSRHNDLKKQ